ncbi:hypothetical protein DAKH74_035550 [Maudiozyma humilis]|uniref:Uncharacterized protein n=1 Tax=Maudiozyma humilis TaxID=51915 RepID=A0AAV5RZ93_MAUHU|nr:hypothetical protein DAKH74_035550 [Kazachstania humilis]
MNDQNKDSGEKLKLTTPRRNFRRYVSPLQQRRNLGLNSNAHHSNKPLRAFKINKPTPLSLQVRGLERQSNIDTLHKDTTKTVEWMNSVITRANNILKRVEDEELSLHEELHSLARKREVRQVHIDNIANVSEELTSSEEEVTEEPNVPDVEVEENSDDDLFGDSSEEINDEVAVQEPEPENDSDGSLVILTDSEVEQPDVNLSSKEEANDINNEEAEEDLESNPANGNVEYGYPVENLDDNSEREEGEEEEEEEEEDDGDDDDDDMHNDISSEPKMYMQHQYTENIPADPSSYEAADISEDEQSEAYSAGYDEYDDENDYDDNKTDTAPVSGPAQSDDVEPYREQGSQNILTDTNQTDGQVHFDYDTVESASTGQHADLNDLIHAAVQEVYNHDVAHGSNTGEPVDEISNDDILEEDIPTPYNMTDFDDSRIRYQNKKTENYVEPENESDFIHSSHIYEGNHNNESNIDDVEVDNQESESYDESMIEEVQVLSSGDEADEAGVPHEHPTSMPAEKNDEQYHTGFAGAGNEMDYDHPSINATYNSGVSGSEVAHGVVSIAEMLSDIPQNIEDYHHQLSITTDNTVNEASPSDAVEKLDSVANVSDSDFDMIHSVEKGPSEDTSQSNNCDTQTQNISSNNASNDDIDTHQSDYEEQNFHEAPEDSSANLNELPDKDATTTHTNTLEIIETSQESTPAAEINIIGDDNDADSEEVNDDSSMYYSILQTNEDLVEQQNNILPEEPSESLANQYQVKISDSIYESSVVSETSNTREHTDYVSPFNSDPFASSNDAQDIQSILRETLLALAAEKSLRTPNDTNENASATEDTTPDLTEVKSISTSVEPAEDVEIDENPSDKKSSIIEEASQISDTRDAQLIESGEHDVRTNENIDNTTQPIVSVDVSSSNDNSRQSLNNVDGTNAEGMIPPNYNNIGQISSQSVEIQASMNSIGDNMMRPLAPEGSESFNNISNEDNDSEDMVTAMDEITPFRTDLHQDATHTQPQLNDNAVLPTVDNDRTASPSPSHDDELPNNLVMLNQHLNTSEINLGEPADKRDESIASVSPDASSFAEQANAGNEVSTPIDDYSKPSTGEDSHIITEDTPVAAEDFKSHLDNGSNITLSLQERISGPFVDLHVPDDQEIHINEDQQPLSKEASPVTVSLHPNISHEASDDRAETFKISSSAHDQNYGNLNNTQPFEYNQEPHLNSDPSSLASDETGTSDEHMVTALEDEDMVNHLINNDVTENPSIVIEQRHTVVTPEELNFPTFSEQPRITESSVGHDPNQEYPTPIQSGGYSDDESIPSSNEEHTPVEVTHQSIDDWNEETSAHSHVSDVNISSVPVLHNDIVEDTSSQNDNNGNPNEIAVSDISVSNTDSNVEEMLDSSDVDQVEGPEKKRGTGFVQKLWRAPSSTMKFITTNIRKVGTLGETFTETMTNPPSDSDASSKYRSASEEIDNLPVLALQQPVDASASGDEAMVSKSEVDDNSAGEDFDVNDKIHRPLESLQDTIDTIPERVFALDPSEKIPTVAGGLSDGSLIDEMEISAQENIDVVEEEANEQQTEAKIVDQNDKSAIPHSDVEEPSQILDSIPIITQSVPPISHYGTNRTLHDSGINSSHSSDNSVVDKEGNSTSSNDELGNETSVLEPDALPILTRLPDEHAPQTVNSSVVDGGVPPSYDGSANIESKDLPITNISIPLMTYRNRTSDINESSGYSTAAVKDEVLSSNQDISETGQSLEASISDKNSSDVPVRVEQLPDQSLSVDIDISDDIDMDEIENDNTASAKISDIADSIDVNEPDSHDIEKADNVPPSDLTSKPENGFRAKLSASSSDDTSLHATSNEQDNNTLESVEKLASVETSESMTAPEIVNTSESTDATGADVQTGSIDGIATDHVKNKNTEDTQNMSSTAHTSVDKEHDGSTDTVENSYGNINESIIPETIHSSSPQDDDETTVDAHVNRGTEDMEHSEDVEYAEYSKHAEDIKPSEGLVEVAQIEEAVAQEIKENTRIPVETESVHEEKEKADDNDANDDDEKDDENEEISDVSDSKKATDDADILEKESLPSRKTRSKKPKRKMRNSRKRKIAITEPSPSEGVYKRTRRGQASNIGSPQKETGSNKSTAKDSNSKKSQASKKKSSQEDGAKQTQSRRRTRSSRRFK